MRHLRWKSICLLVLLIGVVPAMRAQWAPMAQDQDAQHRLQWWRDARFGMFLHWGVYSIPGRGEWVQWAEQIPTDEYAELAEQFHPEHFDANAWAATAKSAGMKYMVLTARHHDGFALFNDPESTFTAMKSAAHHDFVADYVKAVRSAGLGVGLYYSPLDWRFPGFFFPGVYRASAVEMRNQYARQIDQLASNYGKIDLLWFDGGGNEWLGFGGVEFTGSGWRARAKDQPYSGKFDWEDNRTVGHLRALQPSIVINDRTNAAADFRSREGDGALGNYDDKTPWELCTTITEGAWGYQPNAKVKSLESLIHLLVGAAGRDGNMLLNVGPRPDGQIEPQQVERLREIGSWLEQNGESIYGTRGGPWMPAKYGVTTHKDRAIYVHLLQKELPVSIHLPPLPVKVLSVTLLHGAPVAFHQSENGVEIQLAGVQASANDSILLLRTEQSWTGEAIKVADSE